MTPARQLIEDLYPAAEPDLGRMRARFGPDDIGRIVLQAVTGDRIWISNIIIEDNEFRGQGHGSREMARITEAADALGVDICLEAFWREDQPDGGDLQRWYDGFGFDTVGGPDEQSYQELQRRPCPADPFPSRAGTQDEQPVPA